MISLRTQLVVAVVLTLLGVVGLVAYGRQALDKASRAASDAERQLGQIQVVASLEEQLHELDRYSGEEKPPAALHRKILARLADLEAEDWSDPEDRALVRLVAEKIRGTEEGAGAPDWAAVKGHVSQLEKRSIDRSKLAVGVETRGKTHGRARRIVEIGIFVVAGLMLLLTLGLVRYRTLRVRHLEMVRQNDRLAALGSLSASVAHELNNPLATISGCAAAVRDRLKGRTDVDGATTEYLEMIAEETTRCSNMVDGLRDLARDAPLAVSTARLGELAGKVVDLLAMDPEGKSVRFEVLSEEDVGILCDPDKIKQLLLNLLVNARDASEEGGAVRIRVSRPEPGLARLEVEDDGVGIHRRDLARIFEPFHTGRSRGLGIGLFLCERIVTLHRGRIRAESGGSGHGARFVVDLPQGDPPGG